MRPRARLFQVFGNHDRSHSVITLTAPGKTFLVGEYLAVFGGPSIILATMPEFELKISELTSLVEPEAEPEAEPEDFPAGSPASQFLHTLSRRQAALDIGFFDPHQGAGGLGASTAQFAMLYAFEHMRSGGSLAQLQSAAGLEQMLKVYRRCAWDQKGLAPSGADLVAQMIGGVTWWNGRSLQAENLAWNFADLAFTLVHTGLKLATHQHLRDAKAAALQEVLTESVLANLRQLVGQSKQAFQSGDQQLLAEAASEYRIQLDHIGLLAPGSKELLQNLDQLDFVLACKGCGAMGSDILLILHATDRGAEVREWARQKRLKCVGDQTLLAGGLRLAGALVHAGAQ